MRALIVFLITAQALMAQPKPKCVDCIPGTTHERSAAYKKYIEPLLDVRDFHIKYYADGAADATVTHPEPEEGSDTSRPPVQQVVALMKNRSITVPLLIDCLNDGRITSARFDGERASALEVPVGYVCLDILMTWVAREPIADPDEYGDGLGACIHTEFYFRPDDYTVCGTDGDCLPRPWLLLVQKNWKRELRSGRLWKALRKRDPSR